MKKNIILLLYFVFSVLVHSTLGADEFKVVSILPGSDQNYQLAYQTPITVIFNRPVIPLGSLSTYFPFQLQCDNKTEIKGSYRWVTNSIARFDVNDFWPSNIHCTFTVDPQVTTFDKLNLTEKSMKVSYKTESPIISISNVFSEKTDSLTDGHWVPNAFGILANGSHSDLYEVPPDGVIQLQIEPGYDLLSLERSIRIYKVKPNKLKPKLLKFKSVNCSQVHINPPKTMPRYIGKPIAQQSLSLYCFSMVDQLESGEVYKFLLPAGSKIQRNSGPLPQDLVLYFTGLYPFQYVLKEEKPGNKNLRLFHRHAIDPTVPIESFQQAITFSPKVKNLQFSYPNSYTLQMFGDFRPNQSYTVTVVGNITILDGWGLSLETHQFSFTTSESQSLIFSPPNDNPFFDYYEGTPGYYTLYKNLMQKKCYVDGKEYDFYGLKVSGYPVTKKNVIDAMLTVSSYKLRMREKPLKTMKLQYKENEKLYINTLPVHDLWNVSGSYLHVQQSCEDDLKLNFVQQGDLSVSKLSAIENKMTLWVSRTTKPYHNIKNAQVSFYVYQRNDTTNVIENMLLYATGQTDKDGIVQLEASSNASYSYGYVVVEYGKDNSQIFVSTMYQSFDSQRKIQSELITDRSMYNAGEVVHLKGYFRGDSSGQSKFQIKVYWTVNMVSKPFETKITEIDSIFGTFNIDIPIPANVDRGSYYIEISSDSDNGVNFYAGKNIIISDSKLPTGIIKLESNQPFIPFNSDGPLSIKLNVSTSNYLGIPQSNQKVTITWKTPMANYADSTSMPYKRFKFGTNEYQTDSNGQLLVELTFDQHDLEINYGDSIHFEATYVDPSGTKILSPALERVFVNSRYLISLNSPGSGNKNLQAPGVPQPINAQLLDISDRSLVGGVEIKLKLTQWVSATASNYSAKLITIGLSKGLNEFCTLKSSNQTNPKPQCFYQIPDVGIYVIVASAVTPNGETVQSTMEVGQNIDKWNQTPFHLDPNDPLLIFHSKSTYHNGDDIDFEFYNILQGSKLVMSYGCIESGSHFKEYNNLPYGLQTINIKPPKECTRYIKASGVLISREVGFKLPSSLPTSLALYSENKLHYKSFSEVVEISPKSLLKLSISTDKTSYQPGDKGTVSLSIIQKGDNQPHKKPVEACVMIVDKRNLDLSPNPISTGKSLYSIESFYAEPIQQLTIAVTNYFNQLQRIMDHMIADSFLSEYVNFDVSDSVFYQYIFEYINNFNDFNYYYFSKYGRFAFGAPEAAESVLREGDNDSNRDSSSANDMTVKVRDFFETTPLFVGKLTVTNGIANIPFTLPDDVTTFEIRAYVIESEALNSSFEFLSQSLDIISKREYSIQPIAPSFVRVGDQFQAGISLVYNAANFTSNNAEFRLLVNIESTSFVLTSPSKVVMVKPSGYNTNIFYNFSAVAQTQGDSDMYFSLYKGSALVDSVKLPLNVLGKQVPIYTGDSRAFDNNTVTGEGLQLPDAELGSGSLKIFAGVGRYPYVQEKSAKLLAIGKERSLSSIDLLSQQVTFGALIAYRYNDSLIEKSKEALQQVTSAISSYMLGTQLKWYPSSYDGEIYPTLYFILLRNIMDKTHTEGWSIIGTDYSIYAQFIDQYLNQMVENAINKNQTVDKEFIGRASIGLGYYWSPQNEDLEEYSWNGLTANITDNCSLMCQLYFTIAAQLRGEGDSKFIPIVLKNIENNVRIQGRTAYVSESPQITSSSLSLSAYSSLAMILANYTNKSILEKLLNFVGIGGVPQSFPIGVAKGTYYPSGFSAETEVISLIALSLYDKVTASTSPNIKLTVYQEKVENVLLDHQFTKQNPNPVSEIFKFSSLYSPNGTIYFKTSAGSGEITAAIGLEWTPTAAITAAQTNGIRVEKIIVPLNKNKTVYSDAKSDQVLLVGQEVKIIISITTQDDIGDVYILDSLNGGLSALDSLIYGEDDVNPYSSDYNQRFPFYQPFNYKETRLDHILFHASGLRSGSYQVDYNAIVSSTGRFIVPPTKAYSSTQPEYFGLSNSFYTVHRNQQ
ncbi:hypothetical protein DLAC_00159 [Tieghemostelium lacteum]|uniref:Alpha-2-macroglobulin domain-containing protein n=1 Tax=Tieghemostelium lacteum TaxID=361077 RepID=A0A152A902_TIELA|nr:hypothetical protein DLAC_00159 [Tieghemostelium lacteum]|eukprot:KYR02699.1 hypothetical protein DLAC_00159 [Tieghemostelium lacteum]